MSTISGMAVSSPGTTVVEGVYFVGTISLLAASWTNSDSGYYTQSVSIPGYTVAAESKIDLQPSTDVVLQMATDGTTAMFVVNMNGSLTAYAVGNAPSVDLAVQCTAVTMVEDGNEVSY